MLGFMGSSLEFQPEQGKENKNHWLNKISQNASTYWESTLIAEPSQLI